MSEQIQTRQFGRYQLERLISRGGMGEIYLAFTEGPGGFRKQVVIKRMMPHLSEETEFVTRFIDEANIVVSLTHGNIVPVFDMGEVDGDYFIAMEYIPGRDLRGILKGYKDQEEVLPTPLGIYVITETCKALAYAHKKADDAGRPLGIIHRDISPSNVLVSREGIVKLTDFGIAKAVSRLGRSITGRLQGKFCYMSPEQASGKSVDHRTDIFSLGTVAYQVLTGTRPFEAESDLATLEEVKAAEVAPPSSVFGELPQELDAVVLKALARDPDDRYQDAGAFAGALLDATASMERADEGAMAAALTELFPGREAAFGVASSGLRLDDLMAIEADRMLGESGIGESQTLTAPTPSVPLPEGRGIIEPVPTPEPEPQHTPLPVTDETIPPAPRGRRRWGLALVVGLVLGVIGVFVSQYSKTTTLSVDCTVAAAEVMVDNQLRGVCPVELELSAGTFVVSARLQGYATTTERVVLDQGEQAHIRLELEALPEDTIAVTVNLDPPTAEFSFDQLMWARSGIPVEILPGTHNVMVRGDGFESAVHSVTFDDANREVDIAMNPVAVVTQEQADGDQTEQTEEQTSASRGDEESSRGQDGRRRAVRVRITVDPADARLVVDGTDRGRGNTTVSFAPDSGRHTIRGELPGYLAEERAFDPAVDGDGPISLVLTSLSELRPVRFTVVWPGTGELFLDGAARGAVPSVFHLAPGTYRARVRNEELGVEEERTVTVSAGEGEQVERFFADIPH